MIAEAIEVRGRQPMPAVPTPSLDALRAGAFDSQLVSVTGIVRRVSSDEQKHLYFEMRTGGVVLYGQVPGFDGPAPEHLVDSAVTVRAVAGAITNSRRQMASLQLFVSTLADIRIDSPDRPIRTASRCGRSIGCSVSARRSWPAAASASAAASRSCAATAST